MSTVAFRYYLRGSGTSSEMQEILQDQGVDADDDLIKKMGRPFDEVALDCLLNTETGKVTLVAAGL